MQLLSLILATLLSDGAIAADAYPTRPVRVVAPFAPGGGTDTVARVVAQQFAESLGKSFVVDNRTGASGIIANEIVAKAAPDGYTLLVANSAFASLAGMFKTLPYDTIKSFTPISEIMRAPNVLVVHASVSVTTAKDFIALARASGQIQLRLRRRGQRGQRAAFVWRVIQDRGESRSHAHSV